jgi:hypothetical protein
MMFIYHVVNLVSSSIHQRILLHSIKAIRVINAYI